MFKRVLDLSEIGNDKSAVLEVKKYFRTLMGSGRINELQSLIENFPYRAVSDKVLLAVSIEARFYKDNYKKSFDLYLEHTRKYLESKDLESDEIDDILGIENE
jgi:hypothetical protein